MYINPPLPAPTDLNPIVDLVSGKQHRDEVASLRAEVDSLKQSLEHRRTMIRDLRNDIETIMAALDEEAEARDWCEEWEDFWAGLSLSHHPSLVRTFSVSFDIELTRRQVRALEEHVDDYQRHTHCTSFNYEEV